MANEETREKVIKKWRQIYIKNVLDVLTRDFRNALREELL